MTLSFKAYKLYFKRPFKIAHGTRSSTDIVITKIEYKGFIGYGEASLPPYLDENTESVFKFLTKAQKVLLSYDSEFSLENILLNINAIEKNNTAAKASIDIALHDLYGKIYNQPCWKLFNCDKNKTPFTTFTIGIDSPAIIEEKIKEAKNFKILKVKLNGENDEVIINTIRNKTDKTIAVDINQGWKNKSIALKKIEWLASKNTLLIEQPLPKNNLDDNLWLFERSPLPLFADESIQGLTDMDTIKHCFHGINIKLMKCGGLAEALKMIHYAKKINLKILIGCMSESSCAVSAAAQLSAFADYADLDSPLLISNDLFDGIKYSDGKIILNNLPGIGCNLIEEDITNF